MVCEMFEAMNRLIGSEMKFDIDNLIVFIIIPNWTSYDYKLLNVLLYSHKKIGKSLIR